MAAFNIAEAKAKLSQLVDESIAGGSVTLMRRGTPLVRLVPIDAPKRKLTLEWLREMTADIVPLKETPVDFMERLRDEDRY